MPITKVEVQDQVLVVTVEGRVSLGEAVQMWNIVCDNAADKQVQKILVNLLAVEKSISTLENYEFAVETLKRAHELRLQVAWVGTPPITNPFGILVAKNRGANFETFTSVDLGNAWLSGSS